MGDGHRTRYAAGTDGSQIAYQVVGSGPPDLVYLTGRLSNVDVRWEDPASARFLNDLAAFSRLIVFDRRGAGASDQLPPGVVPTWEEWADDLAAVVDAADSPQAAIFAVADGGDMAIAYAAAHPERVEALVLFNGLASTPAEGRELEDIADLLADVTEELWGTEEYVKLLAPSLVNDAEQSAWWAKYMRATATPRAAAAQTRAAERTRTDGLLPLVQAPTLIIARSEFGFPPVELVRGLVERIPKARLVVVPGTDVMPQTQEPELIVEVVQEFLTGTRPPVLGDRFLATVLFTDIVDSTRLGSELGDRAWRDRLDAHDAMVRRELQRHRGREIKTTGDGFLATFDGPGRGVQCARAIRDGARRIGIEIRSGLHAGEVEGRGRDIAGIAVNIAAPHCCSRRSERDPRVPNRRRPHGRIWSDIRVTRRARTQRRSRHLASLRLAGSRRALGVQTCRSDVPVSSGVRTRRSERAAPSRR